MTPSCPVAWAPDGALKHGLEMRCRRGTRTSITCLSGTSDGFSIARIVNNSFTTYR